MALINEYKQVSIGDISNSFTDKLNNNFGVTKNDINVLNDKIDNVGLINIVGQIPNELTTEKEIIILDGSNQSQIDNIIIPLLRIYFSNPKLADAVSVMFIFTPSRREQTYIYRYSKQANGMIDWGVFMKVASPITQKALTTIQFFESDWIGDSTPFVLTVYSEEINNETHLKHYLGKTQFITAEIMVRQSNTKYDVPRVSYSATIDGTITFISNIPFDGWIMLSGGTMSIVNGGGGGGTQVVVAGENVPLLIFNSDPQEQIDKIGERPNSNTRIGENSLTNITGGVANTALGSWALQKNTTGNYNTGIGVRSLQENTTGKNNVSIGFSAGRLLKIPDFQKSANDSIFIGANSKGSELDDQTNQIVIGNNAEGNGSNTVTIGNDEIETTYLKGVVYANGKQVVTEAGADFTGDVSTTGAIKTDNIKTTADFKVLTYNAMGYLFVGGFPGVPVNLANFNHLEGCQFYVPLKAPTAVVGTNDTTVATTEFVDNAIQKIADNKVNITNISGDFTSTIDNINNMIAASVVNIEGTTSSVIRAYSSKHLSSASMEIATGSGGGDRNGRVALQSSGDDVYLYLTAKNILLETTNRPTINGQNILTEEEGATKNFVESAIQEAIFDSWNTEVEGV